MPRAVAWLRIARLPLYPTVFLVYATGVAAAAVRLGSFDWTCAILAAACLFAIEFATMLTNEHFNFAIDTVNENYGPFTGGSRVIVEGALTRDEVIRAVSAAVIGVGVLSALLVVNSPPAARRAVLVLVGAGVVLGLGYSAPPLQLSRRGFGEITVAFLHGTYAMMVGWVTQGGRPVDAIPFLLSMPVFWAGVAAATLAGIPDRMADAAARRKTYAVIFGARQAAGVAIAAAVAAGIAGVLLWRDGIVAGAFGVVFVLALVHGLVLCAVLVRFIRSGDTGGRIDSILLNALGYVAWFALVPFAYFLHLALRS